jgi:hypothetical protein
MTAADLLSAITPFNDDENVEVFLNYLEERW